MYHRPDELSARSDGRTVVRDNACGLRNPVLVGDASIP